MTDQPKELPQSEPPRERSEAFKALLQYITDTPELLSLLYDLNLLPEQLEIAGKDIAVVTIASVRGCSRRQASSGRISTSPSVSLFGFPPTA